MISFVIVGISAIIWGLDFWGPLKRSSLVSPWPMAKSKSYLLMMIGRVFLFLCGVVAFFLFLKGMWQVEKEIPLNIGKDTQSDLYILLDISKSMNSTDIVPSRLEKAKAFITSLIEEESSVSLGIILFSEKVATLTPLTREHSFLKKEVALIRQGDLGDGTNIGDSLALSVGKLKHSFATHKSILLMTDGVSPLGTISPQEAAKWALEEGIQIHTMLLGRDKNLPLPGGSFNSSLLKDLSTITGGQFYNSIDEESVKVLLKKLKFSHPKGYIREDSYFLFFYALFILLIIETIRRFSLRDFL